MTEAAVSSPCPDENALAELVQGLLDEPRAHELLAHLDGCTSCRQIVSDVGRASYVVQRVANGAEPNDTELAFAPPRATGAEHTAPAVGTVLAGKYRVERELGRGGMGVVMAARHVSLGKLVALKLMRPDLALDPMATQRFVREARAASLLRSEHIARVIDLDTLDDGAPYIAMEYLEGEDLGRLLARHGRVTARDAATYVVQVCDAIAEAHAAGIVHRDLKPANLFVTRRGDGSVCVKVLDFGVSKIIAGGPFADDLASTDTTALVGSPHYMAPEQLISAKAVDPRTDVWALGCILFQLVSGSLPFGASALASLLASILRDDAPRLDELAPDLPAGFAAVVARCLEKDAARRYQSVGELVGALARFVGEWPAEPMPAARPIARVRRRAVLAIAGAVALLAGFAATRAFVEAPPPPRAPATIERSIPADAPIARDAPPQTDAHSLQDELIDPKL
ncbi:MAG TPA: serine/threonine-protein kinase [Kofleriaceae bacterium]|jgi:serine/threonine-protein kinase